MKNKDLIGFVETQMLINGAIFGFITSISIAVFGIEFLTASSAIMSLFFFWVGTFYKNKIIGE